MDALVFVRLQETSPERLKANYLVSILRFHWKSQGKRQWRLRTLFGTELEALKKLFMELIPTFRPHEEFRSSEHPKRSPSGG